MLQIAKNRAITLPLAPCPVINPQHAWTFHRNNQCLAPQLAEKSRRAGRNAELLCQTRSCASAQRPRDLFYSGAQPASSATIPMHGVCQALGEDPLSTSFGVTKEAPYMQLNPNRYAFPGKITQLALIVTMHPGR